MYRNLLLSLICSLTALTGQAAPPSERLEDGRQAFEKHCRKCHDNPASGAPAASDKGDWENRSQLWQAVLTEHAKEGYLEMPARGGAQGASDYEVEAATEYMLTISHPEMPHD